MATEKTVPKQLTPFQKGQSGNPAGRPKGARNKLSEDFLVKLCEDFRTHGAAVIAEVRESRPQDYLRVVASILPKGLHLTSDRRSLTELSDDELIAILREARGTAGQGKSGDEKSVY